MTAAASWRRVGAVQAYDGLRRQIGRAILLGLEFLIIADIVLTITVDLTLTSALALGLIVLVRTFLSFSLEIELGRHAALAPGRRPRRFRLSGQRGLTLVEASARGNKVIPRDEARGRLCSGSGRTQASRR